VGRVDLAPADTRAVLANGAAVWVTDGREVRQLAPDASAPPTLVGAPDEEVVGLAPGGEGVLALVRNAGTGATRVGDVALPQGFSPTAIGTADDRVWVQGTANGAPALVLLENGGIRSTVVLDNGRDASFAWVSRDTVLAVSAGGLLRIDLEP
jgi:hypothetical protein